MLAHTLESRSAWHPCRDGVPVKSPLPCRSTKARNTSRPDSFSSSLSDNRSDRPPSQKEEIGGSRWRRLIRYGCGGNRRPTEIRASSTWQGLCANRGGGRGRPCGLGRPMVAAAVILDETFEPHGIRSSKKMRHPTSREVAYDRILRQARAVAVRQVSANEIDTRGIDACHLDLLRAAVEGLEVEPDYVLVDYYALPGLRQPQESIVDGDDLSVTRGGLDRRQGDLRPDNGRVRARVPQAMASPRTRVMARPTTRWP